VHFLFGEPCAPWLHFPVPQSGRVMRKQLGEHKDVRASCTCTTVRQLLKDRAPVNEHVTENISNTEALPCVSFLSLQDDAHHGFTSLSLRETVLGKNTSENRSMVVRHGHVQPSHDCLKTAPVSVNASLRKFGIQKQSRALCACKSVRVGAVSPCLYSPNKLLVLSLPLYSSPMSVSRRVL
jgi:hypothetical protein